MSSQDAVAKFDALLAGAEFLFFVAYRGSWCPFCIAYLETLESLSPAITKAGGTPVVLTSEKEDRLQSTRSASGYTGEAIVDPKNDLATELKKRGLVDIVITERRGYEHGMAQPAILVMKKDGTVLQKWVIVPSLMNIGGATDRPLLEQVWANVESQLKGEEVPNKTYSRLGMLRLIRQKLIG